MDANVWRRLWLTALGSCAAVLIGGGAARADDRDLDELRVRLGRLEEQNARLEQQNEYLKKVIESGFKPAGAEAPAADKKEVEKIVADYLKAQDAKRKADEDKKKKDAEEQGYVVGSDLKFNASWSNGLLLETSDKAFRMHIGGRIQQDWVWFGQDAALKGAGGIGALEDGVFFRRARVILDGQMWETFEYQMEIDFENIEFITFDDLWVGMWHLPYIGTLRGGNIKVPQGLESYSSSRFLTFLERGSISDAFYTEYAPGFWATNTLFDERATWAAAWYRIPGVAGTGADFGDGEYAGTGRISALPWWENDGRCYLHLGASATYRNAEATTVGGAVRDVVRFRSRPEIRTGNGVVGNNNRFVDTGNIISDGAEIVGLEGLLVMGSLSFQAEYAFVNVDDVFVGGTNRGDTNFHGFYAYVSYFLTGEHRPYDRRLGRQERVRPLENFFLVHEDADCCGRSCCHGLGAWEVALRYSWLDVSDAPVNGGHLEEYTLGLNWYWNPNFRVQWNYNRARRSVVPPGVTGDVDEFGMRLNFAF
jgi:phosphate-selective porin OprO/OprP